MKVASPPRTLLIVDDQPSQRTLLGGFLASIGYKVLEAESAEEMLEILSEQVPDLILLDVRLPGISGIDSLPRIRQISATVPILLITAYADLRQAVAALKSGAMITSPSRSTSRS